MLFAAASSEQPRVYIAAPSKAAADHFCLCAQDIAEGQRIKKEFLPLWPGMAIPPDVVKCPVFHDHACFE
jgi:hypothetical protein